MDNGVSKMTKYMKEIAASAITLGMVLCTFAGCASDQAESSSLSPDSVSSTGSSVSSKSEIPSVPEVSSAPSSAVPPASSQQGESGTNVVPATGEPGGLPASAEVSDSYFDDAVFIGDSVSLKLNYYVKEQRSSDPGFFGKAQFLTSGSLGSGNALWDLSDQSVHPTYNGTKMLLEDSVAASGAKKVYIMLGMNDVGLYGVDTAVANMEKLVDRILGKTPDAKIFIQSATPMVSSAQLTDLNNANLLQYDQKLEALCADRGWYFVDVASVMRDSDGSLPREYCSDPDGMGIHFTDIGCERWIEYLRTHTA